MTGVQTCALPIWNVFNFKGYGKRGKYLVVVKVTDADGDYTVDGFVVEVK